VAGPRRTRTGFLRVRPAWQQNRSAPPRSRRRRRRADGTAAGATHLTISFTCSTVRRVDGERNQPAEILTSGPPLVSHPDADPITRAFGALGASDAHHLDWSTGSLRDIPGLVAMWRDLDLTGVLDDVGRYPGTQGIRALLDALAELVEHEWRTHVRPDRIVPYGHLAAALSQVTASTSVARLAGLRALERAATTEPVREDVVEEVVAVLGDLVRVSVPDEAAVAAREERGAAVRLLCRIKGNRRLPLASAVTRAQIEEAKAAKNSVRSPGVPRPVPGRRHPDGVTHHR